MMIKRLVVVFGGLAILAGLSQLVSASWWVDITADIVNSRLLALNGIIGVLFGALMLVALAQRLVIMRGLFAFLGIFGMATGALALLNPDMTRDLVNALMLNRTHSYQVLVVWIGGILRTVVGVLLIYAVVKSPGGLNAPQTANGTLPRE